MSFPELPRPKAPHLDRVIKDLENPRSLINIVSPDLRDKILALPDALIDLTEEEMERILPNPSTTVQQLRRMFWIEFDRAIEQRTMMNNSNIYPGICTREGFLKLTDRKECLAWLLVPPTDYMANTEALLTQGLKRINEMLHFPLKTKEGNFDHKLGELILKATLALDMRVKGGYLQRSMQMTKIESTNTNTNNNNVAVTVSTENVTPEGIAAIDEQLKLIEEEIVGKTKELSLKTGSDHMKEVQSLAIPTTARKVEDKGSA